MGELGKVTLHPSKVSDNTDRVANSDSSDNSGNEINNHAVYIQAFDMSSESATNQICFMVSKSNSDDFCE